MTQKEWDDLMSYKTTVNLTSQTVISSSDGGHRTHPNVFYRTGCGRMS